MLNLRQQSANYEIYLALSGAIGIMALMLHPVFGRIILGLALSLLFVLYLFDLILPRDMEDDSRYQVLLNRVNFLGAACSSFLLVLMIVWLKDNLYIALISIFCASTCIIINLTQKYFYRIMIENYFFKQFRLIVFIVLTLMVFFLDGHGP
jgi:hypothetical protein